MRVGLLTSDLFSGHGWGQYSLRLVEGLQAEGCTVRVLTAQNSPVLPDLDMHPILPNVAPAVRGLWLRTLLCWPQAWSLLRDCDVIHTTVEFYSPLAVNLAGQRPVFITVHGSYAHLPNIQRWPANWLYRAGFQRADLLCVSHYTAQVVRSVVPSATVQVIHNGVDAARFAAPSEAIGPQGGPLIVSSGGVKTRKGTLQLVRAVATVRQQVPDVRCVIIGTLLTEKNYVALVQAEIVRLGLEETVTLTGFVSDEELRAWYHAADIFVLPSINDGWKFEGYGLVYLEAGAAGLPVIGTTDNGAEDAIDHGVTGLLVPQNEVDNALPGAILSLLQGPARARKMGVAGRHKAQQQSWLRMAQTILTTYELEKQKRAKSGSS